MNSRKKDEEIPGVRLLIDDIGVKVLTRLCREGKREGRRRRMEKEKDDRENEEKGE